MYQKIKNLSQKNRQTTVYLNYLFFCSLFKVLVIQTNPLIFGFCMVLLLHHVPFPLFTSMKGIQQLFKKDDIDLF